MIALPAGENRMIVASFVSTKHRNVTEDRQTDGRMAYTAVSIASYADGCKNAQIAKISIHFDVLYFSDVRQVGCYGAYDMLWCV